MATKEPIKIEFKYPWTMTYLEDAGKLIDTVKSSLQPSDPLFGKKIFVSGMHEIEKLLLVDNDTDNTYAIVGLKYNSKNQKSVCYTIEVILTIEKLVAKLKQDHHAAIENLNSVVY